MYFSESYDAAPVDPGTVGDLLDDWGEMGFSYRPSTQPPEFGDSLNPQTEEELARLAAWARATGISSFDDELVTAGGDDSRCCDDLAA